MFIKIPVYFDLSGSISQENLTFLQEILSAWVEKELLGRKSQLPIDLPAKIHLKKAGLDPELTAKMVTRARVIDGLR